MAPSFDRLGEEDFQDDDEEIDFSGASCPHHLHLESYTETTADLQEQYEVRLEEGLDAFVVIDGLPIVPEESKAKLTKFLVKKLNSVGKTREDLVFMPLDQRNMSEGLVYTVSSRLRPLMFLATHSLSMDHRKKRPLRSNTSMALLSTSDILCP